MDTFVESSIRDPKFRTDNFMMYGFKVAQCSKQGRHPWCSCPFAHPTENARRRDPRLYNYTCNECHSYRNHGYCTKGDMCESSHGVFEARLHPDSYRTISCKEGLACKREVCFFYHTPEERRKPTGLADSRAQMNAELGDSAIQMDQQKLNLMAAGMMHNSGRLSSQLSMGVSGPLQGPPFSLPAAMSGMSLESQASQIPHMTLNSETVAPCIRGANKNKLLLREVALAEGLKTDNLSNSLRVAILQGELTPYSSAPSVPRGFFAERTEMILEHLSQREGCDTDKLRGWLSRVVANPAAKNPTLGSASTESPTSTSDQISAFYPDVLRSSPSPSLQAAALGMAHSTSTASTGVSSGTPRHHNMSANNLPAHDHGHGHGQYEYSNAMHAHSPSPLHAEAAALAFAKNTAANASSCADQQYNGPPRHDQYPGAWGFNPGMYAGMNGQRMQPSHYHNHVASQQALNMLELQSRQILYNMRFSQPPPAPQAPLQQNPGPFKWDAVTTGFSESIWNPNYGVK